MSIITKTMAAEVAKKLTEKKAEDLQKTAAKISELFEEMYKETLNPEVLNLFEKHPSYFKSRTDFQLKGEGLNYEYVSLSKGLPYSSNIFTPTKTQAAGLRKALDSKERKRKTLHDLKNEIEITLWSLRSYKKIGEFLPEAIPFLPEKITTALALNVSDLRQRLK